MLRHNATKQPRIHTQSEPIIRSVGYLPTGKHNFDLFVIREYLVYFIICENVVFKPAKMQLQSQSERDVHQPSQRTISNNRNAKLLRNISTGLSK